MHMNCLTRLHGTDIGDDKIISDIIPKVRDDIRSYPTSGMTPTPDDICSSLNSETMSRMSETA